MQSTREWVVALFVGVAVAGCGDAFGPDSMIGTWNLVSVNGSPVPGVAPVYDGGTTEQLEVNAGWYRFEEGSTCVFHIDLPSEGGAFTEDECTWTVDIQGQTVTVNVYDFGSHTYQVSGDTISLLNGEDGNVLVYRKE